VKGGGGEMDALSLRVKREKDRESRRRLAIGVFDRPNLRALPLCGTENTLFLPPDVSFYGAFWIIKAMRGQKLCRRLYSDT
jgi:hypothetical protein